MRTRKNTDKNYEKKTIKFLPNQWKRIEGYIKKNSLIFSKDIKKIYLLHIENVQLSEKREALSEDKNTINDNIYLEKYLLELRKQGNNINQIAQFINRKNDLMTQKDIQDIRSLLTEIQINSNALYHKINDYKRQ
jgi:hypothetical protein